jgi:peroxiredoxin
MMPKTAASFDSSKVVWLAVDSSHFNTPEATRKWRQEKGFAYPTLQDIDGKVGRLYGAKTTPHMFVIDAQGILRYAGAIDNDPRGKDPNRVNYVTSAVGALFQGKAPSPATTQPYGCTVKYRS